MIYFVTIPLLQYQMVRGTNYHPEFWSEIKWFSPWSEFFDPILNDPVRSEVLVRIYRTDPIFVGKTVFGPITDRRTTRSEGILS